MDQPPTEACSLFPSKPATKPFHGMRAAILVEGKPLEVHKMREGSRQVSGSILAAPEQEFEVVLWDGRVKVKKGIEVKLFLGDGETACEWMPLQEAKNMVAGLPDDEARFWRWSSLRVDEEHIRRFRFAKVETTDEDDEACDDDEFLLNLSTIRVQVRRIQPAPAQSVRSKNRKTPQGKDTWTASKGAAVYDPLDWSEERLLSERADKANFALSASFGDLVVDKLPEAGGSGGGGSFTYVFVEEDFTDLTFEFKICSAASIEQLLAEKSPPPPRTIEDADGTVRIVDSDDEDDMAAFHAAEARRAEEEGEKTDEGESEEDDSDDDNSDAATARRPRRRGWSDPSSDGSGDEASDLGSDSEVEEEKPEVKEEREVSPELFGWGGGAGPPPVGAVGHAARATSNEDEERARVKREVKEEEA
ncbi:hypothetical protein JCM6882_006126 [Rhodosporidiobolus microsporus]